MGVASATWGRLSEQPLRAAHHTSIHQLLAMACRREGAVSRASMHLVLDADTTGPVEVLKYSTSRGAAVACRD